MTSSPEPFTPGEAREAWDEFRRNQCRHCGAAHARACPRVRRFEWHPNGELAGVEFWPTGKWSEEGLIWPEQLPPEPEAP